MASEFKFERQNRFYGRILIEDSMGETIVASGPPDDLCAVFDRIVEHFNGDDSARLRLLLEGAHRVVTRGHARSPVCPALMVTYVQPDVEQRGICSCGFDQLREALKPTEGK